jgi:exopolyphosphatase/guanosine-5'-triphosphate,3'-diphosphate pyrophosphatase
LGVKPESVIAVATSQARDAKNGDKFFGELRTELGLRFRTLSGDQEAELTFLGGIPDEMDPRKAAVIDIGGESTEIRSSESGRSLDLGSVRFTERYLQGNPVTDLQYWDCVARVDRELEVLRPWRDSLPGDLQLVGVAGTVTTAACWNLGLKVFSTEKLNGTVLTRGDVHRFVGELKWRSLEERRLLSGIDSHRADVILAGAIILWRAMEVLRFPNVLVSTRGLRFGALRLSESPA